MFDDIIEIVEDDDYKVTINYETMTTTFEVIENDDYNTPLTTREIITDRVSSKVYDLYYKTAKNPNFHENKLLDALLRK